MNKYSYFAYALMAGMSLSAMENAIIKPSDFNDTAKKYLEYSIDVWVASIEKSKITTGLAAVWNTMHKKPLDEIIKNQAALTVANTLYTTLTSNPIMGAIPSIQSITSLNLTGADVLAKQTARIVIQSITLSAIKDLYAKETGEVFNNPSKDLLQALALTGPESNPYNIEFLQSNISLNDKNLQRFGEGAALMYTYLVTHSDNK